MLKPTVLRASLLALALSAAFAGAASAGPFRNRVVVAQGGDNNAAVVLQDGQGNAAALGQSGSSNTGVIAQIGNDNEACLYQMGRGLSGDVTQYGNGQSVAYVQTRTGMRPVSQEVCRAQLATGGRRYSDIYRNTRVSVRPGR